MKLSPYIKINKRKIGKNYKPLIIAEIGINHGGSLSEAKKLAFAAIKSGAEIIKHQTHVVNDEMTFSAKKIVPDNAIKSIYEIMEECALNETDEINLKKFVESKGAIFISTPFSRAAALRLNKINVQAFKIGSGECNNLPLVELICKFGKPLIVSTGMNDINSIKKTVNIIRKYKLRFALLHCTNVYPTPSKLVRLNSILELEKFFPDAVIGLSDHTTSNLACYGAVALGASILERHFTDTMLRKGPDIINSMDPKALKLLIENSNELFLMRGGKKGIVSEEKSVRDFAFATVVTIKNISKGDKFTKQNIWVKRPGTGEIPASEYKKILNKKSKNKLNCDKHLRYLDILNYK